MKKRGQIELSFQMIFSVILIAAFVYAAVVGTRYFLQTADNAKINTFIADVQSNVDKAWLTTGITQTYTSNLPSRIKYVCFNNASIKAEMIANTSMTECIDFVNQVSVLKTMNMYFCPLEGASAVGAPTSVKIDCKGKDCLVFPKIPYCIKSENGKVTYKLDKSPGASKIRLS